MALPLSCLLRKEPNEPTFGFDVIQSPQTKELRVAIVQENGAGWRAGLRQGDHILTVNNVDIHGTNALHAFHSTVNAINDGILPITYWRAVVRPEDSEEAKWLLEQPQPIQIFTLQKWLRADGFGFSLKRVKGQNIVFDIQPGTPAHAAGMPADHVLCKINSTDVRLKSYSDILKLFKSSGNVVEITLASPETLSWLESKGKRLENVLSKLGTQTHGPMPEPLSVMTRDVGLAEPTPGIPVKGSADDDYELISKVIEAEAESYQHPLCFESFYLLSGNESEWFQMIVNSLGGDNSASDGASGSIARDIISANNEVANEQSANGCTLLHISILHRAHGLTTFLLDNGVKYLGKDSMGRLPLHFAAASNNATAIGALIDTWQITSLAKGGVTPSSPAWINSPDLSGFTALHYATENLAPKAVLRLLDAGVNVAAQDDRGQTALHVLAVQGDENAPYDLRMCLQRIADVLMKASLEKHLNPPLWNLVQEDGLTAAGLARRKGYLKTALYLEEKAREYSSKISTPNSSQSSFQTMAASAPSLAPSAPSAHRNECCICTDKEVDCLLDPCSHLTVCLECAHKIKDCPICRSPIKSIRKVYMS